jgi:hypothetical protein
MQGITERTTTQPASTPVDLNQRLDMSRAALSIAGIVVGTVLFAAGAGLFSAGASSDPGYRSAGQWIAFIAGGGLALAGIGIFVLSFVYLKGIVSYEIKARWIWTHQHLQERQQQGGVVIEEERTEWSLRVENEDDFLLIAIYVYLQAQAGKRQPWSNDNLAGELFLDSGNKARLIGVLSEHEARKAGAELARRGIVHGRAQKSAGALAVSNADELLELVIKGMR